MDGGSDGDTATQPNTIFLRQGFFVPYRLAAVEPRFAGKR